MTTLTHHSLSFTFPEIANEVRTFLDPHIEEAMPRLMNPEEKRGLISELESRSSFQHLLDTADQNRLRTKARNLSREQIEAAFRAKLSSACDIERMAKLTIRFRRTLRIPDDANTYWLPPGLGDFPLCAVDDFVEVVPDSWRKRGGVLMPMYQSEALWIEFAPNYPCAVKIGAGKIDAVSGAPWCDDLIRDPQNYIVTPGQPWLDGFCVEKGVIRQFVAMPLGDGYTVEEQLTGKAEFGGIQLQVHPMRAESYFKMHVVPSLPSSLRELLDPLFADDLPGEPLSEDDRFDVYQSEPSEMGLGEGGRMHQQIYADPYESEVWDRTRTSRCFVHLCNALVWRQITGTNPPHPPFTAKEYENAELPWFDYYRDDLKPLKGSKRLAGVKSVAQLGQEKTSQPLPENSSITPELIVQYGNIRRPGEIREFLDIQ